MHINEALLRVNPLYTGNPYTGTFVNSEDQNEMPQNVAFHQHTMNHPDFTTPGRWQSKNALNNR